ncbi:MAG TPA: hypothetical protein VG498_13455 [Terriglobales bacterium]|nr:hypothetical protein [Terriglobales bacterium]
MKGSWFGICANLLVAALVSAAPQSAAAQTYLFNRADFSTGTNPRAVVADGYCLAVMLLSVELEADDFR